MHNKDAHMTNSRRPGRASPPTRQPMDRTVNQEFGKQAFDQAQKLLKDARVPENVQAIAQQGVTASKEFYAKAAAAAQDGATAMNEIADTAWGNTKMLNEKIVQNLTANAEAAFGAAQAIATAKSLPEIAKLQSEFVQKFAAQATEQTKEFYDLSSRATQHLFEKAQSAATKSLKWKL
jgi:phasin family protein